MKTLLAFIIPIALFLSASLLTSCDGLESGAEIVQVEDTELVKCIEDRFLNDEFKYDKTYVLLQFYKNAWVSDSISVDIEKGYEYYKDEDGNIDGDFFDRADVRFNGDKIYITNKESDRIIEIVKTHIEKLKGLKDKEKSKHQEKLRSKFLKYCK